LFLKALGELLKTAMPRTSETRISAMAPKHKYISSSSGKFQHATTVSHRVTSHPGLCRTDRSSRTDTANSLTLLGSWDGWSPKLRTSDPNCHPGSLLSDVFSIFEKSRHTGFVISLDT